MPKHVREVGMTGVVAWLGLSFALAVACSPGVAAGSVARFPTAHAETATGPVFSDGRRVAFDVSPQATVVLDTATHQRRVVMPPPACRPPDGAGGLDALGSGLMFFGTQTGGCARVVSARTGQALTSRPLRPALDACEGGSEVTAIGTYWLSGTCQGHEDVFALSVYWRTGAAPSVGALSVRQYPDLDTPRLATPMCAPLRRERLPAGDFGPSDRFEPYQYEPPYGLRGDQAGSQLELDRCGTRREIPLSVCDTGCFNAQLDDGYVTWSERGMVGAYVPSTHKSYRWTIRTPANTALPVVHTANAIYAETGKHGATVLVGRWTAKPGSRNARLR
jgi:hypothetical protein